MDKTSNADIQSAFCSRILGGSLGAPRLAAMIDGRKQFHASALAEVITAKAPRTQERPIRVAAALQAYRSGILWRWTISSPTRWRARGTQGRFVTGTYLKA